MFSSIPATGQPSLPGVKRQLQTPSPTVAHPAFGSVTVSGGDVVHFGGKKKKKPTLQDSRAPQSTRESTETPKVRKETTDSQTKPKTQETKPAPKYGYFQNNVRAGMGVVLRDVVPVALSLPVMGGFPGFLLALACVPISYISGKIGRRISKDVDHDTLNPVFKYLSSVRQVLSGTGQTDTSAPVVDRLNGALDDAFNLRNGGRIKTWLASRLLLNKDSGLGKFIESFSARLSSSLLRAEVNSRVAQTESVGQAGVAAAKGVADYTFYSAMNKFGGWLTTFSWTPIKAAGEMMKHAGLIKIFADVAAGGGAKA